MKTYQRKTQSQLGLSDQKWRSLESFLKDNERIFNAARDRHGIEEDPPQIEYRSFGAAFAPGGWVGQYPGEVSVIPGKFTRSEYRALLDEISGWLEILSVPTIAAIVPYTTHSITEPRSLLIAYSNALIQYTESVLAHRPHVDVDIDTERGYSLRGSLEIRGTIREQSMGSQQLVYTRRIFRTDTLPNKLLIHFHVHLADELARLKEETSVLGEFLEQHQQYHQQFIQGELPSQILEESIQIDFTDPDIITQTRESAMGTISEVVDLWEAYLEEAAFKLEPDIARQLTVGVKPISKLYELWIYQKLLSILSEQLGVSPERLEDDLSVFKIGSRVRLYYDTSLDTHSQILSQLGENLGRPDFALTVDGRVRWIGDAKFRYRSTINLQDYQRLFGYAVDLFESAEDSGLAILHLGSKNEVPPTTHGLVPVDHHIMRPAFGDKQWESISESLQGYLPNPGD